MYHFVQYEMARSIQETRRRQAERVAAAHRAQRADQTDLDLEAEVDRLLLELAPPPAGTTVPIAPLHDTEADTSELRRSA
jgi:hypothetical protein